FHIAHIVLSYTPDADDAAREKTRQLADRIIAQLRAGHSFQELAHTHSASADANTGGDLGWRTTRDIPSLYTDTITSLSRGEISEPIFSDEGIYILKLVDKQEKNAQWVQQTRVRHILIKPSIIRNNEEVLALLTNVRQRI